MFIFIGKLQMHLVNFEPITTPSTHTCERENIIWSRTHWLQGPSYVQVLLVLTLLLKSLWLCLELSREKIKHMTDPD